MMFTIGLTLLIFSVNVQSLPSNKYFENTQTNIDRSNSTNEINVKNNKVCTEEVCVKESAIIKRYLDVSVDPCDSFYDFACGNFIKNTVIREHKSSEMLAFTRVQDKVNRQLRKILAEDPQPMESNAFQLAKLFRHSCMNETSQNEMGKI